MGDKMKTAHQKATAKYRKANEDKIKTENAAYYKIHKDRIRAQQAEYHARQSHAKINIQQ